MTDVRNARARRQKSALTNRAIRAARCYIGPPLRAQAWRHATNLRTGRYRGHGIAHDALEWLHGDPALGTYEASRN